MTRLPAASLALATALALLPDLQAAPKVGLRLVAEGLTSPLSLTSLPDGQHLVVDQVGQVRLIDAGGRLVEQPVLDWSGRLSPLNKGAFDERGLLDIALHPDFTANRRVFLTYTAPKGASAPADWDSTLRLSEFTLPAGGSVAIDPASEKIHLEINEPFSNHNSGRMAFGPDGHLYLSVGDGGSANDQGKRPGTGNGQNLWTHLGKVLRLDVSTAGRYRVPADNPFADGKEALPEIWAYGLRNPWGMSFDRGGTRELFLADVGQNLFEEVNIITRGGNYGWFLREGFHGFSAKSPNTPPEPGVREGVRGEPLIDPILEYKHTGPKKDPEAIGISITGGYVYRGRALPELTGRYVFGDWSRNWALPQGVLLAASRPSDGPGRWGLEILEVEGPGVGAYITGFGEDKDGELYVLTNQSNGLRPGGGKVWKLVPAKP